MAFLYGLLAAHQGAASIFAAAKSTAPKSATSGFGAWGLWVILGLMFVVMYFVLYRPQKKRQQEAQNVLQQLKRGDEVVTIGGLHGTIRKLTEDTVVIEVDKGVRLTFSRSAIARTLTVQEEEEEDLTAAEEETDQADLEEPEEGEEYVEEAEAEPEETVEAEAEEEAGGKGNNGGKSKK